MPTITVVGSINRDIVVSVERQPRPGETVLGRSSVMHPGGKGANQAVAAARLSAGQGVDVRMVGRVGRDGFGAEMRGFLAHEGIDVSGIGDSDAATGLALITVDDRGENMITVVSGANMDWPRACPPLTVQARDVVVCQLEVPLGIVTSAFAQARAAKATTLLNPAPFQPLPAALLKLTDIIVLNEIELAQMVGHADGPLDDRGMVPAVREVIRLGAGAVVVTLGATGALLADAGGRMMRIPGQTVRAVDTTGAGDCFVGAMASALVEDDNLEAACLFANRAAAVSVTRHGAASSMPRRGEVVHF